MTGERALRRSGAVGEGELEERAARLRLEAALLDKGKDLPKVHPRTRWRRVLRLIREHRRKEEIARLNAEAEAAAQQQQQQQQQQQRASGGGGEEPAPRRVARRAGTEVGGGGGGADGSRLSDPQAGGGGGGGSSPPPPPPQTQQQLPGREGDGRPPLRRSSSMPRFLQQLADNVAATAAAGRAGDGAAEAEEEDEGEGGGRRRGPLPAAPALPLPLEREEEWEDDEGGEGGREGGEAPQPSQAEMDAAALQHEQQMQALAQQQAALQAMAAQQQMLQASFLAAQAQQEAAWAQAWAQSQAQANAHRAAAIHARFRSLGKEHRDRLEEAAAAAPTMPRDRFEEGAAPASTTLYPPPSGPVSAPAALLFPVLEKLPHLLTGPAYPHPPHPHPYPPPAPPAPAPGLGSLRSSPVRRSVVSSPRRSLVSSPNRSDLLSEIPASAVTPPPAPPAPPASYVLAPDPLGPPVSPPTPPPEAVHAMAARGRNPRTHQRLRVDSPTLWALELGQGGAPPPQPLLLPPPPPQARRTFGAAVRSPGAPALPQRQPQPPAGPHTKRRAGKPDPLPSDLYPGKKLGGAAEAAGAGPPAAFRARA
eukprot:tig00020710_g13238.t1